MDGPPRLADDGKGFDYEETRKEIYRRLVREPFGRAPWEIARLTDYQISEIFNKEPKQPEPPGEPETYWETYRRVWLMRGWTEDEVRRRWERENPGQPMG